MSRTDKCWWVRSDPCGVFSANLTVALVVYAYFVIVKVILLPWYGLGAHVGIFTFICAMALISHSRAQFSEPGCVPKNFKKQSTKKFLPAKLPPDFFQVTEQPRVCKRCICVKPFGTHHCSTCGRCIFRMDHHCPWVNNCVAIFNQKYFILFLFWTFSSCIYAGVLLISRFVSCTGDLRKCNVGGIGVATSIITFVEALIFGLFTGIMFFDQISAILDNTPGIDAMQDKKGEQGKSSYELLQDVFGEPFSWRWFFPTDLPARVFTRFISELEEAEEIRVRWILERRRLRAEQREREGADDTAKFAQAVRQGQQAQQHNGHESQHRQSPQMNQADEHVTYRDL